MVTGIIIQARLTSDRYRGKVYKFLKGKRVLEHVIDNLKPLNTPLILSIPIGKGNDELEYFAMVRGITCVRGDEDNVLQRIYDTAITHHVDTIIRICADSPFIRADDVKELYEKFIMERRKRMIWGMGCYIFTTKMLKEILDNPHPHKDKEHCGFHHMTKTIDFAEDIERLEKEP